MGIGADDDDMLVLAALGAVVRDETTGAARAVVVRAAVEPVGVCAPLNSCLPMEAGAARRLLVESAGVFGVFGVLGVLAAPAAMFDAETIREVSVGVLAAL